MSDYEAVGWDAGEPLSARNMNKMESIWTHGKSQIDIHGHPAVHYTETESDAKFFYSDGALKPDADLIDGLEAATLMGADVPLGLTLLHEGDAEDFSGGYLVVDPRWHIADGGQYNGIYTPDMRGYFPKCPNTSGTTGTGGNATVALGGTITYADHMLSLSEIPAHYHDWIDYYFSGSTSASRYTPQLNATAFLAAKTHTSRTTEYSHAAADEAHDHGTSTLNLNAVSLLPQYKALYFITKVSAS